MVNKYTDPKRPPNPKHDVEGYLDFVSNRPDEVQRFEAILTNSDALAQILSSPFAFKRAQMMLSGNYRLMLELAAIDSSKRIQQVLPILCEFNDVQMGAMAYIFGIDDFTYILSKRAAPKDQGGCGDKVAAEMLKVIVNGDRNVPELMTGFEASAQRLGLRGQWEAESNPVAGQILVRIGVITHEDYDKGIEKRRRQLVKARPEFNVCPECREFKPEFMVDEEGKKIDLGNFVQVVRKATGAKDRMCVECARRMLKEGKVDILGELPPEVPIEVVAPVPTEAPAPAPAEVAPAPHVLEKPIRAVAVERPAAAFRADKYEGPAPLLVRLVDQSIGLVEARHWDFGDNTTSTDKEVNHIFVGPGDYTVILIVSNAAGMNTARRVITVKPELKKPMVVAPTQVIGRPQVPPPSPPPPARVAKGEIKADFWYSPAPPAAYRGADPGVHLIDFGENSSVTPDSIQWEYGDGTTDRTTNRYPVHIYEKPGTYKVKMTVTSKGKTASVTKDVTVEPRPGKAEVAPVAPPVEPGRVLGAGMKKDVLEGLKAKGLSDDRIVKFWKEQKWEMELLRQRGVKVPEEIPQPAPPASEKTEGAEEEETPEEVAIDEMDYDELLDYIKGLSDEERERYYDTIIKGVEEHPDLALDEKAGIQETLQDLIGMAGIQKTIEKNLMKGT